MPGLEHRPGFLVPDRFVDAGGNQYAREIVLDFGVCNENRNTLRLEFSQGADSARLAFNGMAGLLRLGKLGETEMRFQFTGDQVRMTATPLIFGGGAAGADGQEVSAALLPAHE